MPVVIVGCAAPTRAVPLVRALSEVTDAAVEDGELRVWPAAGHDRTAVTAVIRVLLAEGIAIDRAAGGLARETLLCTYFTGGWDRCLMQSHSPEQSC